MKVAHCQCGHAFIDHEVLPGHPDGAWECYGDDDCECGQFRTDPANVSRDKEQTQR
jgi:hypothetical protein